MFSKAELNYSNNNLIFLKQEIQCSKNRRTSVLGYEISWAVDWLRNTYFVQSLCFLGG